MITFKELMVGAQHAPCTGGPSATLHLDQEKVVVSAIIGLSNYFREDDRRQCVELVIKGEKVGYLTRKTVQGLSFKFGGISDADQSGLPGEPWFNTLFLHCPTKGCTYTLIVMSYDEDNPPRCKTHQTKMELTK